jgi:hypothetical protein
MKILKRKSAVERLGDSIKDALAPSSGPSLGRSSLGRSSLGRSSLGRSGMGSAGKAVKDALPPKDKAMKAGLAAGALTALTAASAGISSLRRRREGAKDDS